MAAYTAGIIVGAITTVFPMIYLMNYDRCAARILSKQAEFDIAVFQPALPPSIMWGVIAIGAFVLLVCTTMVAVTGLQRLRAEREEGKSLQAPDPKAGVEPQETPDDVEEDTVL